MSNNNNEEIISTPKKKDRNVSKLLSGRLWLTVIAGVSFLSFVWTICQVLYVKRTEITVSETTGIINMLLLVVSNIFTFYFTKERQENQIKTITEQLEDELRPEEK